MDIDLYAKSVQLLERIANSVHDRASNNPNPLFFSGDEINVVMGWLKEILDSLE